MKQVVGFVGGAIVASSLVFAGPAAAAAGGIDGIWSAETLHKGADVGAGSPADAIDLNAITSYNLGW